MKPFYKYPLLNSLSSTAHIWMGGFSNPSMPSFYQALSTRKAGSVLNAVRLVYPANHSSDFGSPFCGEVYTYSFGVGWVETPHPPGLSVREVCEWAESLVTMRQIEGFK